VLSESGRDDAAVRRRILPCMAPPLKSLFTLGHPRTRTRTHARARARTRTRTPIPTPASASRARGVPWRRCAPGDDPRAPMARPHHTRGGRYYHGGQGHQGRHGVCPHSPTPLRPREGHELNGVWAVAVQVCVVAGPSGGGLPRAGGPLPHRVQLPTALGQHDEGDDGTGDEVQQCLGAGMGRGGGQQRTLHTSPRMSTPFGPALRLLSPSTPPSLSGTTALLSQPAIHPAKTAHGSATVPRAGSH
jgi:hypothetical protein